MHRPGSLSGKPDALSRRPEYEIQPTDPIWKVQRRSILQPDQLLPTPAATLCATMINPSQSIEERIKLNQQSDTFVQDIISRLPVTSFRFDNGILYKEKSLVVVGEDCKLDILKARHDAPASGHFGISKTLNSVRRTYLWPGMSKYIKRYVISCDTCA
ncbi:hypothetical protein B5P41_29955 [Bacillus sp. SRB_28]|nr:hypothetical protein B5P41_29955 [Bacillus sp. SRB_28]